MTEYNDWIIWNGGDNCPVPEGTMGQVQLADECRIQIEDDVVDLIEYDWRELGPHSIIAYRTVREPEVVRKELQIRQRGERFAYSFDHVMYADAPRWNGYIAFDVVPGGNPTNVRIEGLSDD